MEIKLGLNAYEANKMSLARVYELIKQKDRLYLEYDCYICRADA
jgi:hypothetical protein